MFNILRKIFHSPFIFLSDYYNEFQGHPAPLVNILGPPLF